MLTHMSTAKPLHSTRLRDLIYQAVTLARAGDHRARQITIGPRSGIITPHTDDQGNLDADDLAAQVWSIGHDEPSDTGTYTRGYYTSNGITRLVGAPEPMNEDGADL